MLLEIGALATIIKNLLDSVKTSRDLWGRDRQVRQRADASISELQQRIEGMAEQLHQSVALSKMLPLWINQYNQINLFQVDLSDDDIPRLDEKILISA